MRVHPDGYKVEMSAEDVMDIFTDLDLNTDGHLNEGEVWCASCFGPSVDHEIILFDTIYDAFKWVHDSIGKHTVDEMCYWCWKDIYDSGTEWEIKKLKLPS